jgi:uncharacterized protein YecT (DUF1311 family)
MRPLFLSIITATAAFQLAACDDGTQTESSAARARDSALASDLRLARGESEVRAPEPSAQSTARVVSNDRATVLTESPGSIGPALPAASNVSAEGYLGPSCASPALPDQRRCLMTYLARSDVALDRNYQQLITALKREAGSKSSDREPATVLRLRTAQRNWLVYRDDECRRRYAGTEGPLWAPTRAKCLAEYSEQRTQELANALNGRVSVKTPEVKRTTTKASTTKRAKPAKRGKSRRR